MCTGRYRSNGLVRRNLSTLSRTRFLGIGASPLAMLHSLQRFSHGMGKCHTSFHGKTCLCDEHRRSNNDKAPGWNAACVAFSSDIFQLFFAYTKNSSHELHNAVACACHLFGNLLLQMLSSHSFFASGLARILGHGLVRCCRQLCPDPVGVLCVGGCRVRMARISASAMGLASPCITATKDSRYGA